MNLPLKNDEPSGVVPNQESVQVPHSGVATLLTKEAETQEPAGNSNAPNETIYNSTSHLEDKVPWYYSVKFKLFILTNTLIILSIGFLSYQNTTSFRGVLNRQSEENLINSSLLLNKSLEQNIQHWVNLGATTLQVSGIDNTDRLNEALQGLTLSNPSIYKISVFQVENDSAREIAAKAAKILEPNVVKYDLNKILKKVSDQTNNELMKNSKEKRTFYINSYLNDKEMPFMQIATKLVQKYEGTNSLSKEIWIVISLAPDSISGILSKNDTQAQYVVDLEGRAIFTANNQRDHYNFKNPTAKRIDPIKSGASKLVLWTEKAADKTPVTSMATPIKSFDLILINQRKSNLDQIQIDEQIRNILLLSWIIFLLSIGVNYLVANGITRKLSVVVKSTAQIARGDFGVRISNFGRDEVGHLSRAINLMAYDIGVLIGVRENSIRQESELRMAEEVQKTMIPKNSVYKNGVVTSAIFKAASECAGDWWGRFSLSDDEELIVLADVTGHGAHSALVGALAYGYFSTLESTHVLKESHLGPETVLSDLNRILYKSGKGSLTLTAVAVLINRRTLEVRVASGAHCQAEHIRGTSSKAIKAKGDLIGMNSKFSASEVAFSMEPNDLIFLYTDGLVECNGVNGKTLSKKAIRKILVEEEESNNEQPLDPMQPNTGGNTGVLNKDQVGEINQDQKRSFQSVYLRLESTVNQHFKGVQTSDDITTILISLAPEEDSK
ncbi:MAG: SpoIIE family protein phosphatase [Pseudomonadota bacterium]